MKDYCKKYSPEVIKLIRKSHMLRETDLIESVRFLTKAMRLIEKENQREKDGRFFTQNVARTQAPSV